MTIGDESNDKAGSGGGASAVLRKQTPAISSGPFEISPASFSSPPAEPAPVSIVPPPMIEPKEAGLSLAAIVGIGCGVFVVLVGLTLLLFR